MSIKRLYIVFVLFSFRMFSQVNLVPNFSFEDTVACPSGISQIYNSLGWINPSSSVNSNPDYFNVCGSVSVDVPTSAFGYQNAKAGNAYAGFYSYNKSFPNAYEYVEVALTDTLKKDSTYCVSFYLSLAEMSGYCTNNVGVYFSNALTTTTTNIILATPQLINTTAILTDKFAWMKVEWQYIALGGEKYITIGNFNSTFTSDTLYVGGINTDAAYYFIDDVYVGSCDTAAVTTNITIPNVFTPNNDNSNDLFKVTSTNLKALNCKIYNRWGILVGELNNVNDSWDGRTTAGIECIDGVYYYLLSAKGTDDKEYSEKGFIQLIR